MRAAPAPRACGRPRALGAGPAPAPLGSSPPLSSSTSHYGVGGGQAPRPRPTMPEPTKPLSPRPSCGLCGLCLGSALLAIVISTLVHLLSLPPQPAPSPRFSIIIDAGRPVQGPCILLGAMAAGSRAPP
ncbi:hypothetical protein ZWY2020_004254 [Hordeum vulgare]|nr:hypothetical protein ZWY2020_004254 [Hordeum vulgare]